MWLSTYPLTAYSLTYPSTAGPWRWGRWVPQQWKDGDSVWTLKDHWSKCLVSISVDKSTNLKKIAVTIGFPLPEFPKLEIPGNPNVRQYRQKLEFSGPKKLLPNVRGPNTAEILEGMHIAALRLAAFLRYTFQFVRLHFCRNPAWFFSIPARVPQRVSIIMEHANSSSISAEMEDEFACFMKMEKRKPHRFHETCGVPVIPVPAQLSNL